MAAVAAEVVVAGAIEDGLISEGALRAIASPSAIESINAFDGLVAGAAPGLAQALKRLGRSNMTDVAFRSLSPWEQASAAAAGARGGFGGVIVNPDRMRAAAERGRQQRERGDLPRLLWELS